MGGTFEVLSPPDEMFALKMSSRAISFSEFIA